LHDESLWMYNNEISNLHGNSLKEFTRLVIIRYFIFKHWIIMINEFTINYTFTFDVRGWVIRINHFEQKKILNLILIDYFSQLFWFKNMFLRPKLFGIPKKYFDGIQEWTTSLILSTTRENKIESKVWIKASLQQDTRVKRQNYRRNKNYRAKQTKLASERGR
jgi:hypothetical protein